ncbi:MAG TPA: hypothetical protein DCE56_00675 [Cyanobacteria bacterium UBA8553]|nr:hypothetical protein [Cyanobacteria bacterium UBA8553]HAJ60477.1 hypothetical protein [Cyanobacteria bacterium UBA8543]
MNDTDLQEDSYPVCFVSSRITELFTEVIRSRQITFAQWYELMTAPLDSSFSEYEGDLITRLIYAVRHGLVKVVDEV